MELSFNKSVGLSVSLKHMLFTCTIASRSGLMSLIHSIHKGY